MNGTYKFKNPKTGSILTVVIGYSADATATQVDTAGNVVEHTYSRDCAIRAVAKGKENGLLISEVTEDDEVAKMYKDLGWF